MKSEISIETGPSASMIAGIPEYFMGQNINSQENEFENLISEGNRGSGLFAAEF